MSGRFYALCTAGLMGTLFLGYCVYFDRKRRSDPDYKKKVLRRRRAAESGTSRVVIDLRDPKVKEEFLMSEMMKANQKMMEGNLEEGIGHLINFVQFSGDPRGTLTTLQQTLPPPIFNILVRAYASIQKKAVAKDKTDDIEVD